METTRLVFAAEDGYATQKRPSRRIERACRSLLNCWWTGLFVAEVQRYVLRRTRAAASSAHGSGLVARSSNLRHPLEVVLGILRIEVRVGEADIDFQIFVRIGLDDFW